MDITPAIAAGRQTIQSYGPGGFKIGGEIYRSSVIVFPEHVLEWNVKDFAALGFDDFEPILNARPEVILLGCGETSQLLPAALRKALKDAGVSLDTMPTGAACRTYNVLLSEERRVAALLLL